MLIYRNKLFNWTRLILYAAAAVAAWDREERPRRRRSRARCVIRQTERNLGVARSRACVRITDAARPPVYKTLPHPHTLHCHSCVQIRVNVLCTLCILNYLNNTARKLDRARERERKNTLIAPCTGQQAEKDDRSERRRGGTAPHLGLCLDA